MNITATKNPESLVLAVSGRLDTTSAPELEAKVKEVAHKSKVLVMDLKDVEYISSAGLRVVLQTHKIMAGFQGKLTVRNPSDFCKQAFEATGMDGVLFIGS